MRSCALLTTAAAAILAAGPALAKKEKTLNMEDYLYKPKEVAPEVAQGGLQKLVDSGVLTLEPHQSSAFVTKNNRILNKVETTRAHHGGGGS